MKRNTLSLILAFIFTVVCVVCCFDNKSINDYWARVELKDVPNGHDWESKFMIIDGYNGHGKDIEHYIDDYTRNDDHSISFVGDDGLIVTIPYPYFTIVVNTNKK